jgi:hypothetical protein
MKLAGQRQIGGGAVIDVVGEAPPQLEQQATLADAGLAGDLHDVTAAGGEFVSIGLPDAITDRNFVTGPAWTCHVEWLKQFLVMLGTRITQEEAVGARG